jgi:hypothetical protein
MESLGFKEVGRYFIPVNKSDRHVGHMRAHAADLAVLWPIQILVNFTFSHYIWYFIIFSVITALWYFLIFGITVLCYFILFYILYYILF